jgi:hypothetical protein
LKKLTSFGAVAFAGLLAILAMVGFQAPAQAYPDAQANVTVDHQTVRSGESFTATASSDVTCDWTLEWDGRTQTGQSSKGSDYHATFRARPVKKTTKIDLHGTCTYDAVGTNPTAPSRATEKRTVTITVEPRRGGGTQVSAPGGTTSGSNASGSNASGSNASGTHASGGHAGTHAGTQAGAAGSDLPGTGGPNRLFLVGGLLLVASGATAVTIARRRAEEAELQASRF